MLSSEARKKINEAIIFFEEKYKKGISYRGKTPEEKRLASKNFAESIRDSVYPNCTIENIVLNGIACEKLYTPKSHDKYLIIYFHSGGLSAGSVESGRIFTSFFVEKHNCIAILPDFRLAPDVSFEEMLEDCYKAYTGLKEEYENYKIILAGISSGAMLALAIMQLLIEENRANMFPNSIIVGSPLTFLDNTKDSNISLANHDIILRSYDDERLLNYAKYEESKGKHYMNPLYGKYENFPPVYIGCGSEERLLDDSVLLFKKIKSNQTNKEAYLSVFPGMWHGFWEDCVPETYVELERIWEFLNSIR